MNTLNIRQGYGATNVTYDVGLLPSYADGPIAARDFPSRAGVSQRIERLARSESSSLHPPTTPSRRDVKAMLVRRARSVTAWCPSHPRSSLALTVLRAGKPSGAFAHILTPTMYMLAVSSMYITTLSSLRATIAIELHGPGKNVYIFDLRMVWSRVPQRKKSITTNNRRLVLRNNLMV